MLYSINCVNPINSYKNFLIDWFKWQRGSDVGVILDALSLHIRFFQSYFPPIEIVSPAIHLKTSLCTVEKAIGHCECADDFLGYQISNTECDFYFY